MDLQHLVIIYPVVILGAICQGSISMGFALIAAPILLMIDTAFVPVPIILSGLSLSLLIMIRERTPLDVSGIGLALFGRLCGAILAAFIVARISTELFSLLFGMVILTAVLMSVVKASWKITPSRLFGAGFLSGLMGTLSSIGGPPIGLLYQHQKGSVIRSALAWFFAVGTIFSLISLGFVGKLRLTDLSLFLWILPPLVLGFLLSSYTIRVLEKGYTRRVILCVSGVSGVLVIVKTLIKYVQ